MLLPLRTGAALVAALAAGTLVGASGAIGTRSMAPRPLAASLGLALAGIALGLALPRLVGADAATVAALAAAALACVLIGAARVPPGPAAGALAGLVAGLGAQAAFARFLAGELPVSVTLGAAVGLGLAVALPATFVRAARAFAPGAAGHRAVDVGTRVLASWVGAVTLLLLALTLRPG